MGMLRILPLILVLLIGAAAGQEWVPSGRFIGSVEIPKLHDSMNTGRTDTQGSVALYAQPDASSKPVIVINNWRHIEYLEHRSDQVSALVFEQRTVKDESWYRVEYTLPEREGVGWLRHHDASQFRSLYNLLNGRMAFMTDAWDRRLYIAPGRKAEQPVPTSLKKQPNAVVAAAHDVGRELWS